MTRVVGLTGGIGAGKSAVSDRFAALGVLVVDTDVISRHLTAIGGAAINVLRDVFGEQAIGKDGALNRDWMRKRIFTDPSARTRLEMILHPLIADAAKEALCNASHAPYAVLVVPLLFERNSFSDSLWRTLVVDCPEAIQIERVMRRSRLNELDVRCIMNSQCPRAIRLQLADDVITNTGSLSTLYEAVDRFRACRLPP